MRTLKLFNSVLNKIEEKDLEICCEEGLIITKGALHKKKEIIKYYKNERLNGNDLNKTFHKSWKKISESSRFGLFVHQIFHYISTYNSDFKDEIYIPNELLEIEDLNLKFKVIKSYSKEEFIEKCLKLLSSGIALKEETIDDILILLINDFDYKFTGKENIKNKEAIIKLADLYNILPKNNVEFLRYVIYKTTNETLLIKNKLMVSKIKSSNFNPNKLFNDFGLEKLSEIFNRFKPLFLAYKNKCPHTINRISKLSKINHKPLIENPINKLTTKLLTNDDLKWLDNASIFHLFKSLQALNTRIQGQDVFTYKIRNGKSWLREKKTDKKYLEINFEFILSYIKNKYNFKNKTFYFPEDIEYPLPTSEKMFVGNIPTGTKFEGEKLCIGVYWENSWGANDLDLSAININGKVGWNADYNQNNDLYYSGDITSAPNGALEYLYSKGKNNSIIKLNVYKGNPNCDYKIVIGKGDEINKKYMMNPEMVFAEIKTKSIQKQNIIGFLLDNTFILLNSGAGELQVSNTRKFDSQIKSFIFQYKNQLTFKWLIEQLGGEIVDKECNCDYNFSLDNLEKESFLIF